MKTTSSGMWQSSICVNARTTIYHTEDDATYTLCKIPDQPTTKNSTMTYKRIFLLKLNDDITLSIPLVLNLCYVFTGSLLTHRQHCDKSCYHDNSAFFNIISYGNKRLFSHIKTSFLRNKNN